MRTKRNFRNRRNQNFFKKKCLVRLFFLFFVLISVVFYFQDDLKFILDKKISPLLEKEDSANKILKNISGKKWEMKDFFEKNLYLDRKVEQIFNSLSISQKVAQLIMPDLNKKNLKEISELIENDKISGFMILDKNIVQKDILKLKKIAQKYSNVPLFISMDAEPSLTAYRLPELADIPNTNELKTKEDILKYGTQIAESLKKLGVNINFAPVYDFGENKEIIADRSFGETAKEVKIRANLFAKTQLQKNILPTAKHFPGHGHVKGDTHKSLQTISGELKELEVFKSAIKNNIPLMMVGHLAVEKNEKYNTNKLPATLSSKIMKTLLRGKLKFKGLIITDSMSMGAVLKIKHGGLLSLKAGSDIILMPENVEKLHKDIIDELTKNNIFTQEFELKVKKVLKLKILQKLRKH